MAASARRARGVRPLFPVISSAFAEKGGLTPSEFCKSIECGTVIGLNAPPGCTHDFPARNNDNIDPGCGLTLSKELSYEPLCPVSHDRISNFLTGRDPQAWCPRIVSQCEARHEPASITGAAVVDSRELRSSSQLCKCGQTFNASMTKPSTVCDPSLDAA
jgi:hypothetical protein